jgi:hypothetical protein
MNLSSVIIQIALFAALIASAVGSRDGTSSAWHAPPKSAFGIRKNVNRTSSPESLSAVTVTMEQQAAPSDNLLDAILQEEKSELESYRNQRIIPASARAAAVAFVSATAIGTARHALERLIPI